jgi:hypothetical protein
MALQFSKCPWLWNLGPSPLAPQCWNTAFKIHPWVHNQVSDLNRKQDASGTRWLSAAISTMGNPTQGRCVCVWGVGVGGRGVSRVFHILVWDVHVCIWWCIKDKDEEGWGKYELIGKADRVLDADHIQIQPPALKSNPPTKWVTGTLLIMKRGPPASLLPPKKKGSSLGWLLPLHSHIIDIGTDNVTVSCINGHLHCFFDFVCEDWKAIRNTIRCSYSKTSSVDSAQPPKPRPLCDAIFREHLRGKHTLENVSKGEKKCELILS